MSTKPLQKLTGTDGRAGRQTDKPMCREAAPLKIRPKSGLLVSEEPIKCLNKVVTGPVFTKRLKSKMLEWKRVKKGSI